MRLCVAVRRVVGSMGRAGALRPIAAVALAALAACTDSRAAPRPGAVATVEAAAVASGAPAAPVEASAPPVPAPASVSASAPPQGGNDAANPRLLVVSAVGDCTLGSNWDIHRAPGSFHFEIEQRGEDYRYPFSGVVGVLSRDDLTIANLETTLTRAVASPASPFAFRGKPEYAAMLREGSVELVSVANNHSHDAGVAGYEETLAAVRAVGVAPFGHGLVDVRKVKGVEVHNLGYLGGPEGTRERVARDVARRKKEDNIVIVSVHWGIEGYNEVSTDQMRVGRAAIDAGADLVLGHHPHVLQGIEEYKGKRIVYSLANFVFGGHSNPPDMDSMIYQELFDLEAGRVVAQRHRVLPVRVSSVRDRNDYRPVLLEGAERERVLGRIATYSAALPRPR